MIRQKQGVECSKTTKESKVMNQNVPKNKEEEDIGELAKQSIEKECVGKLMFEHRKKDEDKDDYGQMITIQFGTLPPVMANNYLLANEFKNKKSDEVMMEETAEVACVLECEEDIFNRVQVTHDNSEKEDDGMTYIEDEIDLEADEG
ncbi:hypothetical protein Adt_11394 [Abeliophyllum distichum]|uniref:Uncharacterized protein n=1 Tax=Abeliophyllum distichum TaxID=126358 RepID=A0ABD1UP72_9LAMI